jgi:hypothetical protein
MRSAAHKHRDIARSILPSRSPRPARQALAAATRHNRRAVRADLRTLRTEHFDDTALDVTRTADREINLLRRYRRQADKLNHFERWAVRATRDLPIEDRLGWLRSVLPAGLIGDHAISHLQHLPEIQPHAEIRYHWRFHDPDLWKAHQRARRRRLAADLRLALERPGGHRAINLSLRSVEDETHRLHDVHGIDALVDVLVPDPDTPPVRYGRSRPDHPALPAVRNALARGPPGRERVAPDAGGGGPVTATTHAHRPVVAPAP